MQNHQTLLRCSRTTAFLILFFTSCLFIFIGCAALFKSAGLSAEQSVEQTAELKSALAEAVAEAVVTVQTGLAEGQDIKTIALKTSSVFLWKILAASGSAIGIILNGFLAKWLGAERKLNKAIITGVEEATDNNVKSSIKVNALRLGVEKKLNARVKVLT